MRNATHDAIIEFFRSLLERIAGVLRSGKVDNMAMKPDHPRSMSEVVPLRPRASLYMESRIDEQLGLLPGEVRRVKTVMSSALTVAAPDTSLEDTVSLMTAMNVSVLVVYEGRRLVGMVTDRDIALNRRLRETPNSTVIAEIMRSQVPYCFEDDLVAEAQALMRATEINWMPVLDRTGRLAGILSIYASPA